jgi:hypothetical protein
MISPEEEEKMNLAEWIWQSHSWIEDIPGYFRCEWCETCHTAYSGINSENLLCTKNPAVIKLIDKLKKEG